MDLHIELTTKKDLFSSCGKYLRMYRKERHVSQMELELKAGLAFGSVCRIENGKINPTKETLIKIAKALEFKPEEVLNLLGF